MTQEITTDQLLARARGDRVRRLRNMANLSRQEMCELGDFKIDTLIGWELARHGGLTTRGAQKILERVAKEGVICTLDWLLYEKGDGPSVVNFTMHENSSLLTDNQKIIEEILLFKKHHPNAVDYLVNDNSMSPRYCKGEYVAGIRSDNLAAAIGYDCVIQLKNDELILRRLHAEQEQNQYSLVPLNLELNPKILILKVTEIIFAAPVIWHRKNVDQILALNNHQKI